VTPSRLVPAALLASLSLLVAGEALAFFSTKVVPSGKVATESREARAFTGVAVSIPATVVLRQGEPASVSVEADDNLLPEVETVVEGGTLKIRYKRNLDVPGRATLRVLVVSPTIESLSLAGSGDMLAESLRSKSLAISVAGSGDVRIAKLEADSLKASIAGSGDVKVAGKVATLSASIAGSGDLEAARLESARAKVSIAGSGDATLWVRESLDVSCVGSGDVRYVGDPVVKSSSVGSGSVTRLGPAP
jgi:hypothetical protein